MRYHDDPPSSLSLNRYTNATAKKEASTAQSPEPTETETKLDPYTPALIEAIDASPGVVVREGTQVKRGQNEVTVAHIGNQNGNHGNHRKRQLLANITDVSLLQLLGDRRRSIALKRQSILPAIQPQGGHRRQSNVSRMEEAA